MEKRVPKAVQIASKGSKEKSQPATYCLSQCSVSVKRHHDHGKSFMQLAYSFGALVHHPHGGEHDSMHTDMVQER